IREFEAGHDPAPDLAIYNRVGDLYLKANEPGAAVQAYEKAADLYKDQGFYNNAIALCGKILRVNPGRIQVYLKLAQLHARKNVVIDAKKNLIEYIERMSQAKKLDEAFQAMKKFADQFPDNGEIRGMLAELLKAAARSDEGNAELAKLAAELDAPPDAGVRKSAAQQRTSRLSTAMKNKGDLVFLDVGGDDEEPAPPPPSKRAPTPKPAAKAPEPEPEPIEVEPAEVATPEPGLLLETTSLIEVDAPDDAAPALGLEPTMLAALDDPETEAAVPEGLVLDTDAGVDTPAVSGLEPAEFASPAAGDFDLSMSEQLDTTGESVDETMVPMDELTLDAVDDDPAPLIDAAANASQDRSDSALLRSSGELLAVDPDLVDPEPLVERTAFEPLADPLLEEPVGAGAGLALIESEEPRQPTIDELEERILDDPDDPELHRALGEALVASGDHSRGNEELELAMLGYEGREDWPHALDVVNELIRIDPSTVRFFQKRVELSFRLGDREHLVESYVELGDALVRSGALDKAVAVYRRVAEHDPENARAVAALQSLAPPEEEAPPPPPKAAAQRAPAPAGRTSQSVPMADDGFVDLGALVMDDDAGPKNTRMRVGDEEPTGDEQKDFQEMLAQFKQGIDKSVDVEDFQTHYDLGVAFKEMGLLDEAIAEFQKALRAPEGRMRASEALGMAFYDKGQFAVAEAILKRAIEGISGPDDQKLGLLYWLGRADEAQQKGTEARAFYERAMAVDIRFLDTAHRVKQIAAGTAS
ncbi:MAG: tetratricopeptide repeat protein, partial [Gemmatimonadales bacterium]